MNLRTGYNGHQPPLKTQMEITRYSTQNHADRPIKQTVFMGNPSKIRW